MLFRATVTDYLRRRTRRTCEFVLKGAKERVDYNAFDRLRAQGLQEAYVCRDVVYTGSLSLAVCFQLQPSQSNTVQEG